VTFGQNPVVLSVVAKREQKRVRHIGLESERFRPVHQHKQLRHMLPAVHPAPANFTFCREPFAIVLCDGTALLERLGDTFRITDWIIRPVQRTACGIDANNSVWTNADTSKLLPDRARFADLRKKILSVLSGSHRRTASRRRPNGSDQRPDDK